LISRRSVLKGAASFLASGALLGGYAFGIEPLRTVVTRYTVRPAHWPADLTLRIAVLADIHACKPWMTAARIQRIVDQTNALGADVTLLLGDYVAGHRWVTDWVQSDEWSKVLSGLRAPLGVHAILGNHDWWEDKTAQRAGEGPTFSRKALEAVGIRVFENDVERLALKGQPFWLAGLGDPIALLPGRGYGRTRFKGVDDLAGTLAKIGDDAPIILMAHEPDIFPQVPSRVALTLSGHTHGGQVRVFGYSPVVPSRFRNRYAYGHVVEAGGPGDAGVKRNLLVSGGLGGSIMPIRLGVPPEIVMVEVSA
jgi:uncharacterized protein